MSDSIDQLSERIRGAVNAAMVGDGGRNTALTALDELAERARTAEREREEAIRELRIVGLQLIEAQRGEEQQNDLRYEWEKTGRAAEARVLEYRQALEQIAAMEIADPLPDEDPLLRLARTVARCNAIARDVLGSEPAGESS